MSIGKLEEEYIELNWKTIPINVLAEKVGLTCLELCKFLRQSNISKEIKPIELQYILSNIDVIPSKQIKENLAMTDSQFNQIMQKKLQKNQLKAAENLTLEEVLKKTKWLIEDKLQYEIDDFLPRKLRTSNFQQNNMSNCLEYAANEKENDPIYKNFTAIAFIICKIYPEVYKPYQFSFTKNNNYFTGRDAKKRYLRALMWVVTEKLGYDLNNLDMLSTNKYFLRSSDLQFYGLGYYNYKELFCDINNLKDEFLKFCGNEKQYKNENTKVLKEKLSINDINVGKCSVEECEYLGKIDIHHIFGKEKQNQIPQNINIDDICNLMPLCPNHHRIASEFDYLQLKSVEKTMWKDMLIDFIKEMDI